MDKFYAQTLGCKVNQAETDMIAGELEQAGLRQVGLDQYPDWCILNTCTVTSQADKKVRQAIRKIKKTCSCSKLVVTGCFTELNRDFLEKEGIPFIIGNRDKMAISSIIKKGKPEVSLTGGAHTRPLIKVQDGCEQNCSYCIVPLVRGKYRSVDAEKVMSMVKQASAMGHGEIVLTGINLGKYGVDLGKNYDLANLIKHILKKTAVERIRLSSIEIGEVTDDLLGLMAAHNKRICSHLHIPLQSGSNKVLKSMGRPYSVGYFMRSIGKIKQTLPGVSITTDIMAGFPGESEKDFIQTLEVIREISFSKLHIFKYSVRGKTRAAGMGNHVPEVIKKARSKQLAQLAGQLRASYLNNNTGKVLNTVLEETEPGLCSGTSDNYIKVFFKPARGLKRGSIYNIFTENIYKNGLWGKIRNN